MSENNSGRSSSPNGPSSWVKVIRGILSIGFIGLVIAFCALVIDSRQLNQQVADSNRQATIDAEQATTDSARATEARQDRSTTDASDMTRTAREATIAAALLTNEPSVTTPSEILPTATAQVTSEPLMPATSEVPSTLPPHPTASTTPLTEPTFDSTSTSLWSGQYFANRSFEQPVAFERADETLIFDWGEGNPAPNVPIDNFSIRWTKCLDFVEGRYIFTVRGDDEIAVYVDDILVVSVNLFGGTVARPFHIANGTHCIKVEMVEGGGNASMFFDFSLEEAYIAPSSEDVWSGQYFANRNFEQPVVFERVGETLIFDWGEGNPAPNVPIDNFSIRWTKCLDFEEGRYIFTVRGDDEIAVYVDDVLVVSVNLFGGTVARPFHIANGTHCIKVEMVEGGANASMFFDFSLEEAYIAPSSEDVWSGQYFANRNFEQPVVFERADETLIFDWGEGNPAPNVPIDNFSIRWTKCLDFEEGSYIFTVRGDDEIAVYVDDVLVVSVNLFGGTVEQSFQIANGTHCIKVEMVEGGANASMFFDFELSDG